MKKSFRDRFEMEELVCCDGREGEGRRTCSLKHHSTLITLPLLHPQCLSPSPKRSFYPKGVSERVERESRDGDEGYQIGRALVIIRIAAEERSRMEKFQKSCNDRTKKPSLLPRTTNLNGSARRVYKGRNDLYICLSRSRPI